jgi:predicted regulator of Ras-like GTPase activity (Roadblock/LC7/MglB family)
MKKATTRADLDWLLEDLVNRVVGARHAVVLSKEDA